MDSPNHFYILAVMLVYVIDLTPKAGGHYIPKPNCCDSDIFCESVPDYPEEKLKKILKREGNKHSEIFGVEREDESDVVSYRYGNSETPLCSARSELVYPKVGTVKNGEKRFVVNLGNDTVQGVRIEVCVKFDKCAFSDLFPSGYSTRCVQKYIYKKLLALGENDGTVIEEFKLPSCCSCSVSGPEIGR